jgi:hypothetical protein
VNLEECVHTIIGGAGAREGVEDAPTHAGRWPENPMCGLISSRSSLEILAPLGGGRTARR